jgi:hypothetical protein
VPRSSTGYSQALKFSDKDAAYTIFRDRSAALPKPELPLITGLVADILAAMMR